MKIKFLSCVMLLAITCSAQTMDSKDAMSDAYWALWNEDVQRKIDEDIDRNRKADAVVSVQGAVQGADIRVEQITHDFVFGAHIFNFNQLGTTERNEKYKALYGSLFNSATIPFYWKDFELEPGKPRFATEYRDTEEFWNNCRNPDEQPHWRRPSTDQLVEFCEEKGIRMHGHPLVWGSRRTHFPQWLYEKYATKEEMKHIRPYLDAHNSRKKKSEFSKEVLEKYKNMSTDEFAALIPGFLKNTETLTENRIREIADRYKGRIHSWDVVNESGEDYHNGLIAEGAKMVRGHHRYEIMPGDYPFTAFKLSEKYFPKDVLLNINDYFGQPGYVKQANRLKERGAKVDILGYQMHIFNPKVTKRLAEGDTWTTPNKMWKRLSVLDGANLPIHISEITIPTPGEGEDDQKIQAVVAANFYRLWFSHKNVMGITWWNVVDGCGYPGEPSVSGLFTRDMEPKPSFHALNQLINHDWKTNLTLQADGDGDIQFRGFKGKYRITWKDTNGAHQEKIIDLIEDGTY